MRNSKQTLPILALIAGLFFSINSRGQSIGGSLPVGCPEISVSGPSGVSIPGELIWFQVTLKPEPAEKLQFEWTTDRSSVKQGQSTKNIAVPYLKEMAGTNVTATVRIVGLPTRCPSTASETAPLIWDPGPELISEFSIPITSISKKYLSAAAVDLNRNPNAQMYMIEYFPAGTSKRSIQRKKDRIMAYFMQTLNFDGSRVTFITSEAERPRTKIYRIPPGASDPNP